MMRLLLFYVSFLLIPSAFAQKIEVGAGIGLTNYSGDVAPKIAYNETRLGGTLFARINMNSTWAFTASYNRLRIGGSDANFEGNAFRNITFRTDISAINGTFEFNFFKYGAGVLDKHFTPYVFWGLGVAFFKPQGLYKNEWYDLRDYQTEGEKNAYKPVTAVMPMGFGFKYMPSNKFSIEAALGLNKTYTDYLDDVSQSYADVAQQLEQKGVIAAALTDPSTQLPGNTTQNKTGYQRGNPDFKDWFYTFNISCTYRIFTRVKCARFY